MTRHIQFAAGLVILVAIEMLKRRDSSMGGPEMSDFINQNLFWFRVIGWLIICVPVITYFTQPSRMPKVIAALCLFLYAAVFFLTR